MLKFGIFKSHLEQYVIMETRIFRWLLLLPVLAVLGCAGQNTHIGRVEARKQVVKQVYAYSLQNGMRLVVKNGATGGPVAIQVWVADGSLYEPAGKAGLSHFVEHMLFTGSRGIKPGGAAMAIEKMGGELVGNTGKDFSYIGATLPGTGPGVSWKEAMEMLCRMAAYPAFIPEQAENQKKVIELEMEERARNVDELLIDKLFSRSFKVHPYGYSLTGKRDVIRRFTVDDAKEYHAKVYVPANMTLVVSGSVNPAEAKVAAEASFGRIPQAKSKEPTKLTEPTQITVREETVQMGVGLTYMAVGWHICPVTDPDIYSLEVLRTILADGVDSRLVNELRDRKELVYDVSAEVYALRDPGLMVINASLLDGDLPKVREELLWQTQKLKDGLVGEEELSRAIMAIEAREARDTGTAEGQAYNAGFWETVYSGDNTGELMDNIKKVTVLDVRRVAQKYLGEGNYTVAVIRDKQEEE